MAEPKVLSALLSLRNSGYLLDTGWFFSFSSGKPVDSNKNPIPWFTYPAIDFITNRLNNNLDVLEFGSGNSTLYFAGKVKTVTTVEHNSDWYSKLNSIATEKVNLVLSPSDSVKDYVGVVESINKNFELIIIDGLHRNECVATATDRLTEKGVIILDDSERDEYKDGLGYLNEKGFKRLDFWGISAGILFKKCTTVFYKQSNCLDI
jgi:hypothetical protein